MGGEAFFDTPQFTSTGSIGKVPGGEMIEKGKLIDTIAAWVPKNLDEIVSEKEWKRKHV